MLDDIQVLSQYYEHFEQLRDDALAWELDFRQIGPGERGHQLLQAVGSQFHFVHTGFNTPYDQRSASPAHLRTFSVLAEQQSSATWCGYDFDWNTVACFAKGAEFRALSHGYFSNFVFSLPEEQLAGVAASQFQVDWERLIEPAQNTVVTFPAAQMRALRSALASLAAGLNCHSESVFYKQHVSELAEHTVRGLLVARGMRPSRAQRNRRKYFLAAQDFIDASPETPSLLAQACETIGVSLRTLEYAFQEHAGMGPKAYINYQRLARVHDDLSNHQAQYSRVSEIANRWGYWHMGQFARDYRKVYGNRPGETLSQRSRAAQANAVSLRFPVASRR